MAGWGKLRALVSGATVVAVLGTYGIAVAPSASAATAEEIAAANALRDAISGSRGAAPFLDGLTAVGSFGSAEPALTLVPSGPEALGRTPLADALAAVTGYGTADSPTALKDALTTTVTLADGPDVPATAQSRTATFTSALNGDTLHVDVVIARPDVPTGIRLHSTSKPIDFTSDKGVTAQPALHLAFDVRAGGIVADPLIALDTTAALSGTLSDVDAALGILGVTLGTPPSGTNRWNVTTHLVGGVRDPNNDGFLSTGPTGELGADGASAGLGTVTVRSPGGGTLDGRLFISPRPSASISNLPGATIDVTATAADLAGDPTADYADGALAPVEAFQRLAPFDLAQGVAQLAVTLDTIEHARPGSSLIDVDLPLARGSLADLVPGNEALQQFLADHVSKSAVLGQPAKVDFASVQGFLDKLAATQGPGDPYDVSISGASFVTTDPAHPKLVFTVNVHRADSAQPTDPLAPMLTAGPTGVTYSGHSITSPFDFGTTTQEFRDSLKGRQVNAGGSSAVIDHVSGSTITLDPVPLDLDPAATSWWKNGTPSGVAYTIEAGDAKTGNVELADTLKATAHLSGANSAYPQATTHAGYDVALPLVLDLEPAVTGAACATPANGNKACPYVVDNPDGSSTVVAELPARPDRIQLTTGTQVLTARSSLSSPVDITAPVGYAPVDIGGTLALDAPGTGPNMTVTTAAMGDKPLGELINTIRATPDTVLTGLATGTPLLSAHAALTLDVRRAPTLFHTPAAPGTASVDVTAPGGTPAVSDPDGDLADLAVLDVDTSKPSKLFDLLLADLGALNTTLSTAPTTGVLGTPVPVLGTTLGQALAGQESRTGATYARTGDVLTLTDSARTFDAVRSVGRRVDVGGTTYVANGLHIVTPATATDPAVLDPHGLDLQAPTGSAAQTPADGTAYSLVDDLTYSVDALTAAPPSDLDQLIGQLEATLGSGAHVTFTVDRTGPAVLRLHVVWPRTYRTSNPLLQSLTLNGGPVPLAGHPVSGEVPLDVTSSTDVTLVVPLTGTGVTDPVGQLTVDPASSRTAHLTASLTGQALSAAAGSFELDLGSGSAVKADLTAAAAGTAGAPVTLGAWTTGLTTVLSGASQSCASGVDGAVCASLPTKAHSDSADLGTVTVTVPTSTTDLSATTAGTAALAAALQTSTLDLGPLGAGLQSYLDTAKDGLDAAIAGGKVPLVGKDLQEGTDFIGKLKAAFATALPATQHYTFATAKDVSDQLKAVFNNPALTDSHVVQGAPTVALACDAVLEKGRTPGVTAVGAPDADASKNASYTYAVAPYHGTTAGQLSDASGAVTNLKVTTSGHHNDVTWASVPYADSYKLYRSTDAGAHWGLIATQPGRTFSDDFSVASGAAPAAVTSPPSLGRMPCADDAPAQSVAAVTLGVKLGQGNVNPTTGACTDAGDSTCLTAGIPIDLGLPGISLKAQKDADGSLVDGDKVEAKLGWTLDLALTLDKKKGVLVETSSGPQPELKVGATITLPSTLNASVSFIKAQLTRNTPGTPELAAVFSVDLGCGGCADGQLPLSSLLTGGGTLTPKLKGAVNVDEHFATGIGAPGDASYDPSLPGLSGEFRLKGTWSSDSPLGFTIGSGDSFGFFAVKLEAGKFLKTALGPIVQDIISTLKPVQPVLDTISAPIPVLSDLSHLAGGDDVTLVTLAQAFGGGSETVAAVIQVINTVKQINSVLQTVSDGGSIDVGSLNLNADKAKTTAATPDNADALSTATPASSSLISALNSHIGGGASLSDSDPSPTTYGFTFPALKHPSELLKLLAGKDVEIAHFDSGPLSFNFTFSQKFGPVYAPPPVLLTISGSAGVTFRIAAGFDTYGIRQAVERGKVDVKVLDSLYFVTKDQNGQLIPVVQFTGELAAGAEVSVAFLSVGVQGGLRLTVSFTWNDPNNDGKFRFSEFLAAALQNPICLFNVGGRLSLFLKVYVTIGFSPFDVSFDFTLADITLLDFSLKPNCTPPPPKLGGKDGSTLYLFAGVTNGSDTQRGAPWGLKTDDPETWVVRQHGSTVTVQALGISEDFTGVSAVVLDARANNDKQRVIALFQGKEKGDHFSDLVVFFGGAGADVVKTDDGPAFIDGGAGDDSITTGDRQLVSTSPDQSLPPLADAPKVVVAGNGGNDHITVGNAVDEVAGDGHLSKPAGATSVTRNTDGAVGITSVGTSGFALTHDAADKGTEGNDVLSVGLGGPSAWGGPGRDQIAVAQDSPLAGTIADATIRASYTDQGAHLYGGSGPDSISAGAGDDKAFSGDVPSGYDPAHPEASQDVVGTADLLTTGQVNTVDTGVGNDVVVGADGADLVTGHSRTDQSDVVLGLAGEDVLTGGDGTDKLYGGRGNDYLVSQPADVTLQGADTIDVLGTAAHPVTVKPNPNPASSKTLVGGGGSDRIYGGDGPSTLFGDHVAVACAQAGTNRSDGPDEDTSGYTGDDADGADLIYGGAGVDTIQAGGGNDWVYAKGGTDTVCGMRGNDHLYGGGAVDTVWGGRGSDVVQGDDGNDLLYGNEDGDTLYGNLGTDTLEGNDGVDALFGGQEADVLIGGTSEAGRADAGDYVYGDEGADVLIGDNGDPTSSNGPSYDLGSTSSTLGGADVIAGGAGKDQAYGGLAGDTIDGNADDDHLEGGPGVDTVHGNDARDDIIGGSSQLPTGTPATKDVTGYPDAGDHLFGDQGDDVVLGDNGQVLDTGSVGAADDVDQGRGMTLGRAVTPYDLGDSPAAGTSGGDDVSGGTEPDLVYGQGGADVLHGNDADDYVEGGPGSDDVFGDAGQDDLVGGSLYVESGTGQDRVGQPDAGDRISGGDAGDVALGDNGAVHRAGTPSDITRSRGLTTPRTVVPYDLGDAPAASHYGGDRLVGDAADDVLVGQSGDDVLQGSTGEDYVEGGAGVDRLEGNAGDDDLVGGSSTPFGTASGDTTQGQLDGADLILSGAGDDVALGDDGIVTRLPAFDPRTFRVGSTGRITTRRSITAYDLRNGGSLLTAPSRTVFGGDQVSGGTGVDLLLGQDGNDTLTGEAGDDYAEGNGGNDAVHGDALLADVAPAALTSGAWQARTDQELGEGDDPNGQDDLLGGSSSQAFRDGDDVVHGNGGADYELGDNGQVVRDVLDSAAATVVEDTALTDASYPLTNRVYAKRYPATLPAGAAYVRHGVSATSPTRFCTTAQATCEPATAFGDDQVFGDGGDDTAYGQDGNDTLWGGDQDDDLYGELGNDVIDGGNGDDAVVGDRGGVVDVYNDGTSGFALDYSQVPKIHYDAFQAGTVTRRVDLQHDVNGDAFLGASGSAVMPHRGDLEGGDDRIRGRAGRDSIHAGFGEDLANGDSGGDTVYGDDGADVLWGGKGSDDPLNPADRGPGDSFVDYVFGGKGGDPGATKKSVVGADILDWRPRGTYGTPGPTTCSGTAMPIDTVTKKVTTTVDPCSWFEMTDITPAFTDAEHQHHQGIDWIYGGWDRDVLQGDVADNGPNLGDRLLDWNGTYNLYTHCNAAYGGYNDVRQHSPGMQSFLQQFAWTTGAGQVVEDVTTEGTSAFDELALAYPGTDNDHASGSAFPTTPGHFDNPNACAP